MRPAARVARSAAQGALLLFILLLLGLFARVGLAPGMELAREVEQSAPAAVLPAEREVEASPTASAAAGAAADLILKGEDAGSEEGQPVPPVSPDRAPGPALRGLPDLPAGPKTSTGAAAGLGKTSQPRPAPTQKAGAQENRAEAAEADVPKSLPVPEGLSAGVLDGSPMRRLVIPALKLDTEVVEAPFVDRTWDISDLGGKIAWLSGTSWPSQEGNTALAGHITARGIGEGPFRYLHHMKAGDEIRLYTEAYVYIYRVREQIVVKIEDIHVLAPTEHPQLTLLTCTNWDKKLLEYRNRRVVFADLVRVEAVNAGF